jgi:hypothetical protein
LLTTQWSKRSELTDGHNRHHGKFEAKKFLAFPTDALALKHSKQTPSTKETAHPSKKSKKKRDLNSSSSNSSSDEGAPPSAVRKPKQRAPKPSSAIDVVLSSDGGAATEERVRPKKSGVITAKAMAMSRAREEAATRVPLHPPRTVMTNDVRLQRAIDRRASPNVTDPALLLADPPTQMPPSPTPRTLTTSRTGILEMTACDHPQWTMQTDEDLGLVVLLRVDLSDLV